MGRDESRATAPGVHEALFRPAPALANRQLQTIWAPLVRRAPALPLRRERCELPDGDFLDLDRLEGEADAPLLLVLHGLEGSSSAGYVRGLLSHAHAKGWRGAALNFRSCSGASNRLARSYHSGDTGDVAFVVDKLLAEQPGAPLFLAGVSLGGNVLVKWLGELGESAPPELSGAAAISVPFDLALCAQSLDGSGFWARVYRRRFLATLLAKARDKAARFPAQLDARSLEGVRTLTSFDDRVTAHLHGFHGAADYYARSSSSQYLARVRVPLLLISAEDDPFIPAEAIPRNVAAASGFVRLEVSKTGGHVGFVEGAPGSTRGVRYWAEERVGRFLEALLEKKRAPREGHPF